MLARLSILQRVTAGFLGAMLLVLALAGSGVVTAVRLGDTLGAMQGAVNRSKAVEETMRLALEARRNTYQFAIDQSQESRAAALSGAEEAERRARAAILDFADAPELQSSLSAAAQAVSDFRAAFQALAEAEDARGRIEAEALDAVQVARDAFDALRDEAFAKAHHLAMAQAGRVIEEIWLSARRLTAYADSGREEDRAAWDSNLADLAGDAANAVEAAQAAGDGLPALAATATRKLALLRGYVGPLAEMTETRKARLETRLHPAEAAMISSLDAVRTGLDARMVAGMQAGAATADLGFSIAVGAAVAGAAAVALIAVVIGRSISGAVAGMASDMRRIAAREAVEVMGAEHGHEIGDMARALKVFQGQQADLARAEKLRVETEARSEAERREMLQTLRDGVGAVVEAAVEGDFERRVQARFADPELAALAASLNRLMDSVRDGLGSVQGALEQLADGDLDADMRGDFRGEFATLKANLRACVGRLQGLVAGIRAGAEAIRGAAQDMAKDAGQLSHRAEGQAASLEETAATMEELSATVKGNAENSRAAADLSSGASRDAVAGAEIVASTAALIGRIEQGSAKIGEITGVIDGIAFQTNLLALNAAVEAARAGEAGKGFAVVAAEVRTLAQRSAEAARDIKRLIEESGAQVREGAASARQAGEAIAAIVQGVQRLEATIGEISAASVEQSSGVQEISSAVAALDESTQHGAGMAQQAARRSKEMLETVDDLVARVAEFRGGEAAGRGRAAA